MSQEQSGPLSVNLDTTAIKTTVPVIAEGHSCHIRLANIKQTQKKDGPSISFEYHLLQPAPTTEGGQVKPGFPLFEHVTLYDKNTPRGADGQPLEVPEWAIQKISKRIDAFLGTGDIDDKKGKPQRPAFNAETVAAMLGKEAFVKVKVKTGEYTGNDIVSVTFPGDMQP